MNDRLTPYDTGERLEPNVWILPDRRRPREADADRYGKVDFDNDEGATIMVAHVERRAGGGYTVVIDPAAGDVEIEVILNGDRLVAEPAPHPLPADLKPGTVYHFPSRSEVYGRMATTDEHSPDL